MKISRLSGLIFVLAACLFAADARGSLTYVLSDHPDGGYAPPLYGLVIQDFNGDTGNTYTWQFTRPAHIDPSDWTQATLVVDGNTVTISGSMYGGLNDGNGYDANYVGQVDLNYSYTVDVSIVGDRIEVTDDNSNAVGGNMGTLTAVAGQEWFQGDFELFDKGDMNNNDLSFIFDNDGHRLDNHPSYDQTATYVGRGWQEGAGTRDFLFTATLVPEPSSMLIWAGAGLAFAGLRRRNK